MAEHELRIILDDSGSAVTTTPEGKIKASTPNLNDKGKQAEKFVNNALNEDETIEKANNQKENKLKSFATGAAGAMAIRSVESLGKTGANMFVSSIGSKYANQALENRIENAATIASSIGSIGAATAAGSMAGPVGAVLGFATASIAQIMQMMQNNMEFQMALQESERESNRSQERLGLIRTNRNR